MELSAATGPIARSARGGYSDGTATITLIGSDFAINNVPVGPGEFTSGGAPSIHGTITGTLLNGHALDNGFYIYEDSKLIMAPLPAVGDASLDGSVSIANLSIMAGNWKMTEKLWTDSDFNRDGRFRSATCVCSRATGAGQANSLPPSPNQGRFPCFVSVRWQS